MTPGNKPFTPEFDATLGDRELAKAREDVAIGRWQGLPELLHSTGQDWDRRTHRIRLLAQSTAGTTIAEEWYTARPGDPDALVLRADTEVLRCFNLAVAAGDPSAVGQDRLDMALRTCLRAADAHPHDPMPLVSLLTIARLYPGGHHQFNRWWQELRSRHQDNREAHNQALRHVSARWHGSHGTMYDFARDVVDSTPPGSALAVLLQVARLEEYRYRLEREGEMALFLRRHWNAERALADTRRTWDLWVVNWDGLYRAQDTADLNRLLHATCAGRLYDEAGYLFKLLAGQATVVPWSYFGDPATVITRWHRTVMHQLGL
ncbi:hypothetical protein OHA84_36700 [Streptomyces sp. NBC_00513]|uniref:hypothetical protein n=1 Tax=unclassified Streptomyces TaxID=2593676 RepID=UPI00225A8F4E|nr:hypothetical protein [Streptomyces sp. NBC_00424]MCX5070959.1 hypothetical protein [Streptomyces sp. NBC_00424]WUD45603.1 hypothetical protein OHA84_36700 [Streptomyces sp. NBC_00513]